MNNLILEALFATNAIRVCDPEHPFWYTSGTIGPFYINTHFLYKDEMEAARLLLLIEEEAKSDRIAFPEFILADLLNEYRTSKTYRLVIDMITEEAKKIDFDFISGGERRDFFFSMLPAYFLKKPHLSIFKDLQAVYTTEEFKKTVPVYETQLAGKKALHIADLVTEASSYTRAWIPVVREFGAEMEDTIAVVNRKQGGEEILASEGVRLHSFADIDITLFENAEKNGAITAEQLKTVRGFMADPKEFMSDFFRTHPDYIKDQLALGGKAKERAEMAIEKGYASRP
jgi:orotate phosphoribosyltransferase